MEESVPQEKNILFFGALDSFPNIDAFTFIMDQVYSLIKATLETSGVKLFVAGRRETPIYKELIAKHGAEKHVRILGGVDDMLATVKASLFTVFPVHQTSGTRVRVLEAAKAKRTGVTTTLGAEGYDLGDDCLLVRDSAEDYAKGVIELIEDEKKCISMGESLYEAAKGDYGEDVVAANLASDITTFQPGRIRLAIVANRFVPEGGGAEISSGAGGSRVGSDGGSRGRAGCGGEGACTQHIHPQHCPTPAAIHSSLHPQNCMECGWAPGRAGGLGVEKIRHF